MSRVEETTIADFVLNYDEVFKHFLLVPAFQENYRVLLHLAAEMMLLMTLRLQLKE